MKPAPGDTAISCWPNRAGQALTWAVLFAAIIYFSVRALPRAIRQSHDLTVGYAAAHAWLSGRDPYAPAVLADELSRADPAHLDHPLAFYEARRRKRVEAAQDDSRHMARMMFIESVPFAWGLDKLGARVTALGGIAPWIW